MSCNQVTPSEWAIAALLQSVLIHKRSTTELCRIVENQYYMTKTSIVDNLSFVSYTEMLQNKTEQREKLQYTPAMPATTKNGKK